MSTGVVKSAGRVLALLEHLRELRRPVGVTEVAQALNMPQSSASVLLRSLEQLGYLSVDRKTRRYRTTYRVGLLGDWVQESMISPGPLTYKMDALAEETGETIILAQQNGVSVQYIHVVPASYPVQLRLKAGTSRPMVRTATGTVLLALKSDREIRAIVRRSNAEAPDETARVREAEFLQGLAHVRREGWAQSRGSMTPGACVIAVGCRTLDQNLAIGVGGPIERIDQGLDAILEALRRHVGS